MSPTNPPPKVEKALGRPNEPYILGFLSGENIYIPCNKASIRLLVTGKETEDTFAVVGSNGVSGDPIGFHYHNDSHDIFLCMRGEMNVWANNEARTLKAGDMASIPPKTIHQYQMLGPHSEFSGVIVPGGWEEFFRFLGEAYDGPLFPIHDDRPRETTVYPRLMESIDKFDVVPVLDHKAAVPKPCKESTLPGKLEPFFLANGTGPAYILGGTVCRPLVGMAESAGRFTMSSIEGSSFFNHEGLFAAAPNGLIFDKAHHCLLVQDGLVDVVLNGHKITLNCGESIYIPRGMPFRFTWASRFAMIYTYSNHAGLAELLPKLGSQYNDPLPPEKADAWDHSKLKQFQEEIGYRLA